MSLTPADFPLQQHLGMTLESARPGHAVARLTIADQLLNPNGVLHGAVLFAMADTGMGAATMSVLNDGSQVSGSRWTVSGENAGRQIARYSAPSGVE